MHSQAEPSLFCDVGDVLFYDFPIKLTYTFRMMVELRRLGLSLNLEPWKILDSGGAWRGPMRLVPRLAWREANRLAWAHVVCRWDSLFLPIPGAREALVKLNPSPWLVANQPREALVRLSRLGWLRHVQGTVVDCDYGVSKPDPRIFQIACARARVAPAQVIMVGDRLDNDVVPARRLGMRAAWVQPYAYDPELPVSGVPCEWRSLYEQERTRRLGCIAAEVDRLSTADRPTWAVASLADFVDSVTASLERKSCP